MSDAADAAAAQPEAPGAPLPAENRTRGTLFALLILPAGIIVWSIVSAIGFISGWVAIGIALGALWLYRKGSGGRIGFDGAARVSIITVVTLVLAFFAGVIASNPFYFQRAFANGKVIEGIGATLQYAGGDLVISILLPVIFAILGIVAVFRTAATQRTLPPPA
jgi:hypothetical protein